MLLFFFIFKARLPIFWVVGHTNYFVKWYDCHNDRTRLSRFLGCGSLRPPMKISRSNTPWLIGLRTQCLYVNFTTWNTIYGCKNVLYRVLQIKKVYFFKWSILCNNFGPKCLEYLLYSAKMEWTLCPPKLCLLPKPGPVQAKLVWKHFLINRPLHMLFKRNH